MGTVSEEIPQFEITPEQLCQWGIQFDPNSESQTIFFPPNFLNQSNENGPSSSMSPSILPEPPLTFETLQNLDHKSKNPSLVRKISSLCWMKPNLTKERFTPWKWMDKMCHSKSTTTMKVKRRLSQFKVLIIINKVYYTNVTLKTIAIIVVNMKIYQNICLVISKLIGK